MCKKGANMGHSIQYLGNYISARVVILFGMQTQELIY